MDDIIQKEKSPKTSLEAHQLCLRFGDKLALDNLSFNVGKGEIFPLQIEQFQKSICIKIELKRLKLSKPKHQIRQAIFCLFLFMLSTTATLQAQVELTWDDLADVKYDEQFDEEIDGYWLIPNFGKHIKSHQNEIVSLEGYLLLLDMDMETILLSKNTYSACFFCGLAGPESIVELQLREPAKGIKMDQRAKVTGKLVLNRDDFDHFNYILKDAVIKLKK